MQKSNDENNKTKSNLKSNNKTRQSETSLEITPKVITTRTRYVY